MQSLPSVACRCVQAAINVGRWARYVKSKGLIAPLAQPMNRLLKDADGRRSLRISFHNVEKVYLTMPPSEQKQLMGFYAQTKDVVPYLERGSCEQKGSTLKVAGISNARNCTHSLTFQIFSYACLFLGHSHSCWCPALANVHRRASAGDQMRFDGS